MSPTGPERGEPAVRADRGGIGYLLNQAARGVRAQLAGQLREHGINDSEFIVLRNAAEHFERTQGGVPTSQIAEALHLSQIEVEESSARLARDGWVEIARVGNVIQVLPTHKAMTLMPVLADTARWSLEAALNGFSRDEIAALSEMLRRIIHNSHSILQEPDEQGLRDPRPPGI